MPYFFRQYALVSFAALAACSQTQTPQSGEQLSPEPVPEKEGYTLVWHDEFDATGSPDSNYWSYEQGFMRNEELQWYHPENVRCAEGVLLIEGRREQMANPDYVAGSNDWKKQREFAEYTSASINTRGKYTFQYGLVEVSAKIDTALGMWPAIWTLGTTRHWPANGEVDIMEFYRVNHQATVLANAAWADATKRAAWDEVKLPLTHFTSKDTAWSQKFHVWKMDWTAEHIRLYLDDELLNEIDLTETINPDGFNPFHQPHYLLLNLAIGSNGGDPSQTTFPRTYEVDYVRVYQRQE